MEVYEFIKKDFFSPEEVLFIFNTIFNNKIFNDFFPFIILEHENQSKDNFDSKKIIEFTPNKEEYRFIKLLIQIL